MGASTAATGIDEAFGSPSVASIGPGSVVKTSSAVAPAAAAFCAFLENEADASAGDRDPSARAREVTGLTAVVGGRDSSAQAAGGRRGRVVDRLDPDRSLHRRELARHLAPLPVRREREGAHRRPVAGRGELIADVADGAGVAGTPATRVPPWASATRCSAAGAAAAAPSTPSEEARRRSGRGRAAPSRARPQRHSRRPRRPRCRRRREARSCSIGAYTGLRKEQSTCARPSPRTTTDASAGASSSGSARPSQGRRCLAARAARPTSLHPVADLGSWAGVRDLFDLEPNLLHFASFLLASHPRQGPRGDPEAPWRTRREPGRVPPRQRGAARATRSRSRRDVPASVARRHRADRQHDDGSRPDVSRSASATRRRGRDDRARLLRHPRVASGGGEEDRRRHPLRSPLRRPGDGVARAHRFLDRACADPSNALRRRDVGPPRRA